MPVVLLCKLEQGGDVLRVFFDFSMSFVDESALLTLPTPPFTYSIALLFTLKLVVDFVSIEKKAIPFCLVSRRIVLHYPSLPA